MRHVVRVLNLDGTERGWASIHYHRVGSEKLSHYLAVTDSQDADDFGSERDAKAVARKIAREGYRKAEPVMLTDEGYFFPEE